MQFEPQELALRAEQAQRFLRQLSNRYRLMVLCQLSQGECSVGDLNVGIPLSQSALSQHLAVLRKAGVVETRRQSQTIFYRLSDPQLLVLLNSMCELSSRLSERDL
ncbi:MAG: metalloregulator ArsR/SmtB family transcription factor [Halopseudomonas sp.]